MLVQFNFDNYRSIKDSVSFSMVSGTNNNFHTTTCRNISILPSSVIYGANASGKTNVLRAFDFMKNMVLNSKKVFQSTDSLDHNPFLLSTETAEASSSFEIIFIKNNIKYRYGFEADSEKIYSEWLFADEKGKEAKLFFRDIEDEFYINPNKFKEGHNLKALPNSLFIWKCDQENGKISSSILEWFSNLNFIDDMRSSDYIGYTLNQMNNNDFQKEILNMVKWADLGIQDIDVNENKVPYDKLKNANIFAFSKSEKHLLQNSYALKKVEANFLHSKYNENQESIGTQSFDLIKDESQGTKKYFCLSAPFIDSIKNGKVLIIDELDASLHPMLTKELLNLFNDPKINTKNAQLIFSTHDTSLLDQKIFHKSQIWFSKKDQFNATHLTSLVEFKNIRPSTNIKKHYLQGKFGAIPFIDNFKFKKKGPALF